jgi:hypothetical protein
VKRDDGEWRDRLRRWTYDVDLARLVTLERSEQSFACNQFHDKHAFRMQLDDLHPRDLHRRQVVGAHLELAAIEALDFAGDLVAVAEHDDVGFLRGCVCCRAEDESGGQDQRFQ